MKRRKEFTKKLLIADYIILALLMIAFCICVFRYYDTTNFAIVLGAWIAQVGVSSGFYCWKAKAENLVKLPIIMLDNLPKEMKDKADPNQIIASVLNLHY